MLGTWLSSTRRTQHEIANEAGLDGPACWKTANSCMSVRACMHSPAALQTRLVCHCCLLALPPRTRKSASCSCCRCPPLACNHMIWPATGRLPGCQRCCSQSQSQPSGYRTAGCSSAGPGRRVEGSRRERCADLLECWCMRPPGTCPATKKFSQSDNAASHTSPLMIESCSVPHQHAALSSPAVPCHAKAFGWPL